MNCILEPSVFTINEAEWNIQKKRDEFLQFLLDVMFFCEIHEEFKILWSDELEELLWSDPSPPPWRQDKIIRNSLVPVILKKFYTNVKNLIPDHSFSTCVYKDDLIIDEKFKDAFKNLSCHSIQKKINFNLICGLPQIKRDTTDFICESPREIVSIKSLKIFELQEFYISTIWPKNNFDFDPFIKLIEHLTINSILYKFNLTNEFKRDLLNVEELRFRIKIIDTICHRLKISSTEARSSPLYEEKINEEFRIRVTPRPTSTRIHFIIQDGLITFKRFYPHGSHDDGL